MFAGHLGAALAIGHAERRVNPGVLIFAAMLADFVLWMLVLCGIERVTIPSDFAATHQPQFSFPWSHGLIASIGWSVAAAVAGCVWAIRGPGDGLRIGAWIGLAVLSHWFLDALVHRPELPVAGGESTMIGAGLWNDLRLALGIEAAVVIAGLALYLRGARIGIGRGIGMVALSLTALAVTALGMTIAPPPPSAAAMALTSLAAIVAVTAAGAWLGRNRDRDSF
jgi:hypothetical protein